MYTVELFVVMFHTSPFPLLSSVANIKSARSIVWQDHAVIVRVADTESWTGMQTLMHSRVVKGPSVLELADRQDMNNWESGIQASRQMGQTNR